MTQEKEFGARLERIRMACGFTSQLAFAEFLGATKSQYNNWVKGINGMPVEFARKLRDKFGYTLDYIYCDDVSSLPLRLVKSLESAPTSET